ncbi:MAG: PEP-CTERM sorting domain-containing protein [Phycisphaerae bacterium]|nr:PEP-CTERM sorting domain-containing protein [Phycisphaerae bacterium]
MNTNVSRVLWVMTACVTLVSGVGMADYLVYDDFNRADSYTLGTTQAVNGATAYNWVEVETAANKVQIGSNRLYTYYTSGSAVDGCAVDGFTLADGIISVDAVSFAGNQGRINYRMQGSATDAVHVLGTGYHFDPADGGKLYYGDWTVLGTSSITVAPGDNIKIEFEGNVHKVYVNDALGLTYNETTAGRTDAGYIGLGTRASNYVWDNFSVSAIPEPATMCLLAVGGLGVLLRKKR